MIKQLRRQMVWKLFVSYFVVILVGIAVLATAVEYLMPGAFERHLAAMAASMHADSPALVDNLFANFRSAVNESLAIALLTSFLVALVVSVVISRQIVTPVRHMMDASRRIADGHYHERVAVPAGAAWDSMDELGRLAVSFNQMAARLEHIEAARLDLIGNVAHELRTPLTTIKGAMEGLIDGALPADPSTFQMIHREAGRLQRLVSDLQQLSQVESGASQLRLRSVTIARLVESVVARLALQFEEKGVSLATDAPDSLPEVHVDEDRIGQVLLNLVGNALQYTPSGGWVKISAWCHDASAFMSVTDSGIGVSAEHLPLLFTRFYRVDRSRSRAGGGSGIGLTIARHLVEAHGGHIWAESAGLGHGSTFTFSMPLTPLPNL